MPHLISQNIAIKDWPLLKPGDEKFFGYVVAIGLLPYAWGEAGGLIPYVDFSYNDEYSRYHLPTDKRLRKSLHEMLRFNLHGAQQGDGIYGKVWIKLTMKGYVVDLP